MGADSLEVISSSSTFLGLPDTLSAELIQVASEGFWGGFKMATTVMLGMAGIVIAMHLINRAAGR